MSLTKDGFYKSFSGAIGNNNYLLEAGGGHIGWGNAASQIPYSNGTVNSNLNADMVDGLHVHGGRNNEANKIVRTDGSGYIQAGWINTTSGDMGSTAFSRIYVSNDAYIRYVSVAQFKTSLFGGQVGSPSVPIYWTGSAFATCIVSFGNSSYGEHNANNINDNGIKYYNSNGPSTSLGATTSDGALYSQAYNTSWVGQIAQDYRNGGLYVRGKNNGTWKSWYRVWDNRTTYVSGGKGYIGSTEITQVNNADTVDGHHQDHLLPYRYTYGQQTNSGSANWYVRIQTASYISEDCTIYVRGTGNNTSSDLVIHVLCRENRFWGWETSYNGVRINGIAKETGSPEIIYLRMPSSTTSITFKSTHSLTIDKADYSSKSYMSLGEGLFANYIYGRIQNADYADTLSNPGKYYWANLSMQTSPNTSTSPTFNITTHNGEIQANAGIKWAPGTNIRLPQSANGQEWSFDISRNGYTGGYWHVWDSAYGSLLTVYATEGDVLVNRNLGVGGRNTTYKLHINGTGNFENNIWVRGSGVYLRLGPQNSSHAHYETNAGTSHWFNKRVDVNGDIYLYGTSTRIQKSNEYVYAKGFYHLNYGSAYWVNRTDGGAACFNYGSKNASSPSYVWGWAADNDYRLYSSSYLYKSATHTINNSNTSNTWLRIATITISGTGLSIAGFTAIFSNRECLDNTSFILTLSIRRNNTTSAAGVEFYYNAIQGSLPRTISLRSNDNQTFYVYFQSAASSWTTYYNVTKIMTEGNVTYENVGTTSPIAGSITNVNASKGGNVLYSSSLLDRTNGTATYANYGASGLGLGSITWLTCWNGYELRTISKGELGGLTNVYQHTTNNVDYPLVWSNQNNTSTVQANQLHKSYADLVYNPANKRIVTQRFQSSLTTSSHIAGLNGTNIPFNITASAGYNMALRILGTGGAYNLGVYNNSFTIVYGAQSIINAGTNSYTHAVSLLNLNGMTHLKNLVVDGNNHCNESGSASYRLYVIGQPYFNTNGSGAVLVTGTGGSYREGIRIQSVSSWADITLLGTDATLASGTSANSWFIGNNNGSFYITRNGSSSGSAFLANVSNIWHFQNRLSIDTVGRAYPYSTSTRRAGMYGVYDSTKLGHIWSMGTSYMISDNGADPASLYGLAYFHTNWSNNATYNTNAANKTAVGTYAGNHQVGWFINGVLYGSIGDYIWSRNGFIKNGSNNNYVLLGGGGHKALSGFSMSGHTHTFAQITNKITSGNEFNFVDAEQATIWFNYRRASTSSATTPTTQFNFGRGTTSATYAYLMGEGFKKNGSSDNYCLTGGGSHKQWTTNNTANALVSRDGSGDTYVRYSFATYFNSSAGDENPTIGSVYIRNTSDNYIRRMSRANFGAQMRDSGTMDGRWVLKSGDSMSGTLTISVSGTTALSTSCQGISKTSPTTQNIVINGPNYNANDTMTLKHWPGIGFHMPGRTWGSLIWNGYFTGINASFDGYVGFYGSGFWKHGSSNSYLLRGAGDHIAWGNAANQIPYSNGTLNTNLNADMVDGYHASGLFTNFSNIGSQTTRITIGGKTKDLKIDADLLDGYHASGLFTSFGNSGNNITATIGGTTKTFTVNYASNAGNADTLDSYHANTVYKAATHTINNGNTSNTWIRIATITISGTSLAIAGFTAIFSNRECLDNTSFILTLGIRRNNTTSAANVSFYYTALQGSVPRTISLRSNNNQTFYVYFQSAASSWTTYYNVTKILTEGNITYENVGTTSPITGSITNINASLGGNVSNADTLDGIHASGLFTSFGNSGNNITATIGGTTKTFTVNYASNAGNADTVDGQHFTYSNSSNSPTYLWGTNSSGSNFLAARGSITVGYATYANNVYVTQNISSNANYPLIWTNQNNTSSVWGQQLYKSYDYLLYNPSTKVLRNDGPLWLRPDRDATLKIYSGKITDGYSDGFICMQTSIDGTDGQSHSHPTNYGARCVIALQPRGGEVYIGKTITAASTSADTTYKLNVGGHGNFDGNIWARGSGVYLRLGPQNGTYAHYETNASTSHWFNKRIDVNGDIYLYGTSVRMQKSNGYVYSSGFYHNSYGSATYLLRSDGGAAAFNWSGQSGQPTWVWGGNSQHTYYVYNPSNFSVNYANSAGSATNASWLTPQSNFHTGRALGYAQTSNGPLNGSNTTGTPTSWSHYILMSHDNGQTYYHYQLAFPFWDAPMYQRKTGGSSTSENQSNWYTFLTTENWTSIVDGRYLPLAGGWMDWNAQISFKGYNGSTSVYSRIGYATSASGQTMHCSNSYQNNGALYITSNGSTSSNDTGGLAIDNEGVTVFGAGDAGSNFTGVFRVLNEDNVADGAQFLVTKSSGATTKYSHTAQRFISNVATGTQPYACSSTTCNTNLNADLLDGYHANRFAFTYNSANYGSSSGVTVNDLVTNGVSNASHGMIYSATDNPVGSSNWVHVWSQQWTIATTSSWVSQIALGVQQGTGMWYRTTSGNVVGRAWTRVLDSSNWTSYGDGRYVKKAGDTMTGALYINYAQDVGLNQNGSLIIGNKASTNLSFDDNEIMARNNSAASILYINAEGGTICLNETAGYTGIGTNSPSYKLHVAGDSYTTGWSRAGTGFYCEGNGVHFTHNGTVGQISMTSNNEFNWGAHGSTLYFNYRSSSIGSTVTNYIWNAGTAASFADHTIGSIHIKNGQQNVDHWFVNRIIDLTNYTTYVPSSINFVTAACNGRKVLFLPIPTSTLEGYIIFIHRTHSGATLITVKNTSYNPTDPDTVWDDAEKYCSPTEYIMGSHGNTMRWMADTGSYVDNAVFYRCEYDRRLDRHFWREHWTGGYE